MPRPCALHYAAVVVVVVRELFSYVLVGSSSPVGKSGICMLCKKLQYHQVVVVICFALMKSCKGALSMVSPLIVFQQFPEQVFSLLRRSLSFTSLFILRLSFSIAKLPLTLPGSKHISWRRPALQFVAAAASLTASRKVGMSCTSTPSSTCSASSESSAK